VVAQSSRLKFQKDFGFLLTVVSHTFKNDSEKLLKIEKNIVSEYVNIWVAKSYPAEASV